jgi:hypothetical protein
MKQPLFRPITSIEGSEIIRWIGIEMALSGGESAGGGDVAAIQWAHPSMPYLQLDAVDIYFKEGLVLRMYSQMPDGTGHHGLILVENIGTPLDAGEPDKAGSIFRIRELHELPLGIVSAVESQQDSPNAIIEAEFQIARASIQFISGEIYERENGELQVVTPDESILVQINGCKPIVLPPICKPD